MGTPSRDFPWWIFGCAFACLPCGGFGCAVGHRLPSPPVAGIPRRSARENRLPDALALWQRTLAAGRSVRLRAHIVETHRPVRAAGSVTELDVIEGAVDGTARTPRYRVTYVAPRTFAGVVIVNDGAAVWRYDPLRHVAIRHTASTAPLPPELEEGIAAVPVQADGARAEIEAAPEYVDGRRTAVLALRRTRSARIVERRWIDFASGRTLRMEQYAGSEARMVRRVELSRVVLLSTKATIVPADALLAMDFPAATLRVDARAARQKHLPEAEAAARRVRMPVHVRGFALKAAERLGGAHSDASGAITNLPFALPSRTATTHLLYSDGTTGISVFISLYAPVARQGRTPAGSILVSQPGSGWEATSLDSTHAGYVRQSGAGCAIAWAGSAGCYVAVAHMSAAGLLPLAAAFAANRDDAPLVSGEYNGNDVFAQRQ